mmetsp:Transcript_144606/g.463336  ORF Transcript_144606/g.463336 Transcript_144606/m.463336 type:complete len:355 (+) Transcript_144606:212-1276(+)
MEVGEACEVRCAWRPALVGGAAVLPFSDAEPQLPVSFRLLLVEVSAVGSDCGNSCGQPGEALIGASPLCHAASLLSQCAPLRRQRRHFLARDRYGMILELLKGCSGPRAVKLLCDALAARSTAEVRLGLDAEARRDAEALVEAEGRTVRALSALGEALLRRAPEAARQELEVAARLGGSRARQLLERALRVERHRRRAAAWFDGEGAEERSAQAGSGQVCHQCKQYRPDGRLVDESHKQWAGKWFCESCWECWGKIRRSQQRELDRRVENAVHSDYSTHTDELPSLEDTPKDWDGYHPMWHRARQDMPAWQVAHLSAERRQHAVERTAARERRLQLRAEVERTKVADDSSSSSG